MDQDMLAAYKRLSVITEVTKRWLVMIANDYWSNQTMISDDGCVKYPDTPANDFLELEFTRFYNFDPKSWQESNPDLGLIKDLWCAKMSWSCRHHIS